MEDLMKRQLLEEVDARQSQLVGLCQDLIRIPSVDREANPPGDTTEIARFVRDYLQHPGVECKEVVVREGLPNLIARVRGKGPGPHIVLNGHFDHFSAGERSKWTHEPFGGELEDGRIYGRGAIDMKGGDAALITAFLVMAERRQGWNGTVTLTLFSDEETGAKFGAEHVVEHWPEVHGDMALSAEPSGVHLVRFGEKGATRLTIRAHGKTGHGPVPTMGRNAIHMLMDFLSEVRELAGPEPPVPEWLHPLLKGVYAEFDRVYGEGASRFLSETTVNVGVIRGGVKDSNIPQEAEAWLDIRTHFGRTHSDVMNTIRDIQLRHADVDVEVRHWRDPNYSDPKHKLFTTLIEAVQDVSGSAPHLSCSVGGTDLRFWRRRGIPCAVYGPTPHNLATEDEYAEVADLVTVAKAHALTLARLLG